MKAYGRRLADGRLCEDRGCRQPVEAQLLTEILTERRIPHVLKSYYDAAYDGLFQTQKGWGAVYAPPAHKEEIDEIIAGLHAQEG